MEILVLKYTFSRVKYCISGAYLQFQPVLPAVFHKKLLSVGTAVIGLCQSFDWM